MLRFDPIPYPLWRRRWPGAIAPLVTRAVHALFPAAGYDAEPPHSAIAAAHLLARFGQLPAGMSAADAKRALAADTAPLESAVSTPPRPFTGRLTLPAQWEPLEAVIVTFPVLYPVMWETHLQMIEAISPVARVDVLVPAAWWARIVRLLVTQRGKAHLPNVRILRLPTDDVWVRDYGPLIGRAADGTRAAVSAVYDPLPHYPQSRDDAMPARWCAHHDIPLRTVELHTEGGNIWADGAGTLIMSADIYERNPHLTHDQVLAALHDIFAFEKLIITPYLEREETGHVDLVCKLAAADAVLVSAPPQTGNTDRLARTIDLFRRETNAAGQPYRVYELPTPPLYFNWGAFPVFRSYTNALTVNGRVLVPVFGVETDAAALALYQQAMPAHTIIGIDCAKAANGGGAVHCLTKEVPQAAT